MDTLGFEPRAFRMRSGCDTTTPCAQWSWRLKSSLIATECWFVCFYAFGYLFAMSAACRNRAQHNCLADERVGKQKCVAPHDLSALTPAPVPQLQMS